MLPIGLDPQKLLEVQRITQFITGSIEVDAEAGKIELILTTDNPEAALVIPSLVSQFADQLATQLSSFFMIKGGIIEV